MVSRREGEVVIEGAHIYWLNFSGEKRQFNEAGERNFHVDLDPVVAEKMLEDGWNVKYHEPREEGDLPIPHVKVKVEFDKGRPPNIVSTTAVSHNRTKLDRDTVSMLDSVDILDVDMIITPFRWDVNGKTGIAAYLKTMFVTIDEDVLELKHAISQNDEE